MDSIYPLTESEKNAVEKGLADIEEGRVYSSEVAENMIKGWQKK